MTKQFVQLKNRQIIRISGEDSESFLQGLITNDVGLLKTQPCIYSCLLTPQGKFLHDFFLIEDADDILIDTDAQRADDLIKRLTMFKLRSKVTISKENNMHVFAFWPYADTKDGFADPRHADIGGRIVSTNRTETTEYLKEFGYTQSSFTEYDFLRINMAIPDGARDMKPEFATLLDSNIQHFNGISWDKGCYMGQELTARMNYRGLAKKMLIPVTIDGPPPAFDTPIKTEDGKLAGEMRSHAKNVGLALLKKNVINQSTRFTCEDTALSLNVPDTLQ